MNIIKEYPPNYAILKKKFSLKENDVIVFTYGSTIYNPSGRELDDHIIIHEQVHERQQTEIGIEEWWDKFVKDPQFRLDQELEAYAVQYAYAKPLLNSKGKKIFLNSIASFLSGSMYGNILTHQEAESKIRHKAKTYE